ncbi:MAG: hypothetical protein LBB61_09005, partial [Treponema sp.]|nr:hypothetical protein [Treponema sp.]
MKTSSMRGIMRIIAGSVTLSACILLLIALLSCMSGPDEATQQAFNDAKNKTEAARKQAMDFGGATYAADEWNAAETLYNTIQSLPLITMNDYQAAIPQFDDTFNGYMAAFNKAAPQYLEARKNLIAAARQNAVDAGVETHLMLDLSAVDEQDQNTLTLFANKDYYGYQTASFEVEKRYGVLAAEAAALSLKDEITANKFDRFDPDALASADESMTAATTAYTANDLDTAQSAADEAAAKYRQVLMNGWKNYAGEQQQLAQAALTDAVAMHADIALKDDFDAADAVYNQAATEYDGENYQTAGDSFVSVQSMFTALTAKAGEQQKNAANALQAAQRTVGASRSKSKAAFPAAPDNEFLTKANELLTDAQSALGAGNYAGAIAAAAEAQKSAGLSDAYVAQQQKMNAANDALAKAKQQMDGVAPDVQKKYATLYNTATTAYADALNAQKARNWDTVAADAKKINDTVLAIAKAKATDDAAEKKAADAAAAALAAAKKRLDGVSADNQKQFADPYRTASTAYTDATKAQSAKDWNVVNANVKKANDALDLLDKAAAAALAAAETARLAAEKQQADAAAAALAAAAEAARLAAEKQQADADAAALAAAEAARLATEKQQADADAAAAAALAAAEAARLAAEKQQADAAAALAIAKDRLDWATSIGAAVQYPAPYGQASSAYNEG